MVKQTIFRKLTASAAAPYVKNFEITCIDGRKFQLGIGDKVLYTPDDKIIGFIVKDCNFLEKE